jgi:hypothetical protein
MTSGAGTKTSYDDRRRFNRYSIPEDALVADAGGRNVGRVIEAGGGGMLIRMNAGEPSPVAGSEWMLTITEPGSRNRQELRVTVRYRKGDDLGVEFSTRK